MGIWKVSTGGDGFVKDIGPFWDLGSLFYRTSRGMQRHGDLLLK